MQDGDKHSVDLTLFLNEVSTPEFEEVDNVCAQSNSLSTRSASHLILRFYFHITRVSRQNCDWSPEKDVLMVLGAFGA